MPEVIETSLPAEGFSSDRERLEFLEKRIVECIWEIRKDIYKNFSDILEARITELGIDSEQSPRRYGKEKTKLKKDTQCSKNRKLTLIAGLDNLRKEFGQNPMLKNYAPEFNALIDAARTMFLSQLRIRH